VAAPPAAPLSTTASRLFALIAASFVCTRAATDPDLWGHLRFGLDAIRDRHIADLDPYSFNQGVSVLDHEWLGEVVLALAYNAGGVVALLILKVALLVTAFGLLAFAVRRLSEPARWWLLALGIVAIAPGAYTIRPQLWTLVAIPALWHALNSRRLLACVPLMFALWANLHGGWVVGAGIAALWLVGRIVDARSIRAVAPAAVAITLGLLATLVNPYGWRLWLYMLALRPGRNITEFRPLWQQSEVSFAVLWIVVAFGIVVPTVVRRRSTITWAGALPVTALGLMSLFVARLVPLFSEVAVLGLAGAWRSVGAIGPLGPEVGRPRATAIVDVAIVTVVALVNLVPQSRCLVVEGSWIPDLAAAAAFRPSSVQGRLVLPFNWGQYAIWHWGPRLRVSMDGRHDTVYTQSMIDLQSAVAHGRREGLEYLDRVRPDYVWLRSDAGAAARAWLTAHGYRLDVNNAQSFIASRADLPPLVIGSPMPRCFP
jgi:hypothetical protein